MSRHGETVVTNQKIMEKLCCIFNYAPLYRESIYKKIDETFDTQFIFGSDVLDGKNDKIEKLDYNIFRLRPVEVRTVPVWRYAWRKGICTLPFKGYDAFLLTADLPLSYIPFLLFCRMMGKRVYSWGHGPKQKGGLVSRFINKMLVSMGTKYLCYSEKGRQRMIELGYPADKLGVIYNSLGPRVDASNGQSCDVYSQHFGNSNPVLIFTGRLTARKKLDQALHCVKSLKDKGVPCNLMIVGDGSERANLEKIACELDIVANVWFYGRCYDENELNNLIYNADVCISPGDVGLTALHSMIYGVPVISHGDFEVQMPEYETIEPYKTGLLFERDNLSDFVAKVGEWLGFASGRRDVIRQNCRDMINGKWNADHQIEILKEEING